MNMFTVMFAVARSIGWTSQWFEMMSEGVIRIGRPGQLYVGPTKRTVKPIEERGKLLLTSSPFKLLYRKSEEEQGGGSSELL